MFQFSESSKKRREGVDPRLIEISDLALSISVIDFGIPRFGGRRNTRQQRRLFACDRSKCDGIILKSYHQSGKALDVYAYIDGHPSWKPEHLALVACAMLQAASMLGYKLQWGGLWPWDKPHFQLID